MAIHSSILAWRIPMDRGAWRATVHGVAESGTTERLSTAVCQAACLLSFIFLKIFFFQYGPFSKSLLNLLQYCFCCLYSGSLALKYVGILDPQTGIESTLLLHWKVKSQPLDHEGSPSPCLLSLPTFSPQNIFQVGSESVFFYLVPLCYTDCVCFAHSVVSDSLPPHGLSMEFSK